MSWTLVIVTALILFMAAFTKAVLGFGESLLAMPLLAFALGVKTATPLVGLVSMSLTLLLIWRGWRQIEFHSAWRVIVAAMLGIPVGVWVLRTLPSYWLTVGLGVVLILAGIYNLMRSNVVAGVGVRWGYVFGFVGGVLGGAYNTGGPPIVMYGTLRRWPAEKFQATLQGCFLPMVLLTLFGHGIGGLWTEWVIQLYALTLPVVLLAFWLGQRWGCTLSGERVERLVHIGMIALGAMLVIKL
jgi:uncharacterized membrane protein YfcA